MDERLRLVAFTAGPLTPVNRVFYERLAGDPLLDLRAVIVDDFTRARTSLPRRLWRGLRREGPSWNHEPLAREGRDAMSSKPVRSVPPSAAALLVCSALCGSVRAQTVSFETARDIAVGANPQVVAVSDFDRDGLLDMAVANAGSASVSVLLGNGDGTFRPRQDFPVLGVSPTSVALGDFDGDLLADLVTTNKDSSNVSVLLGNGDGTFQAPRLSTAGGSWPNVAAVADLSGDGIQDLAVATFNGGTGTTLTLLLGNGDGTFRAPTSLQAQQSPLWVAAGDVDADGRLDLVTANFRTDVPSTVSVLPGNGDGTFQTATHFPAGDGPASVILGLFDGDALTDLAVANYGGAIPGTTLSVLLGTGGGSFGTAQTHQVGNRPITMSTGDFDGDGIEDLVAANWADAAGATAQGTTVSVLLGRGDGTFGIAQTFTAGRGVVGTAVADFDRDGRPDLVVANYSSDTVSILLNNTGSSPSHTLSVVKAGSGSGTVTSSPAGIDCGPDCSQSYATGTVVTLTAAPAGGSTFAGWSGGGCSGTGPCTEAITASVTVTATFEAEAPPTFTLDVARAGSGSGTVTSSPAGINCGSDCSQSYTAGTVVTLAATPAGGSTFAGWSGACSGTGPCTVTMDATRSVTATFAELRVTLTVTKSGLGLGTVGSSPAGIDCGTLCTQASATFDHGTQVTLTAMPALSPLSAFSGWSGGGCSGTGPCTITLTSDTTVNAQFRLLGLF